MTTQRAKNLLLSIAPLLITAVLSGCGSGSNTQDVSKEQSEISIQQKSHQGYAEHFTPVAVGSLPNDGDPIDGLDQIQPSAEGQWGGDHASVTVTPTGMKVQFDCAQGESSEAVLTQARDRFSTIGVLTTVTGSPELQTILATYTATLAPQTMSLRVAYEVNGQGHTEDYFLERNRKPVFFRCP